VCVHYEIISQKVHHAIKKLYWPSLSLFWMNKKLQHQNFAFSALKLLVWHQEEQPACKN